MTVLIDRSASMDALAPDVAPVWSDERLDTLREHAMVTVIDHAGDVIDTGSERSRESSPLRTTIGAVLERGDADHLVLLTDAIDTSGGSIADLSTQETRVHALALDGVRARADARVVATPATALAYSGQRATLIVRVQNAGLRGRTSRLSIEHGGEVVHERDVTLGAGLEEFRVEVTPTLPEGVTQSALAYTARLDPLAGEADEANNASVALLNVSAEPIRVLVLEGQPHWDTRFFVRAMRADGQVELTSASTLDDRFRSGTRTPRVRVTRSGGDGRDEAVVLPTTVDALAAYDVIVVGRGIEQFFPGRDARRLVKAVTQRGTSVLFFRGDPVVSSAPEAQRASRELGVLLDAAVERTLDVGVVRRAGVGVVMTASSVRGHRGALLPPTASAEERSAYAREWSRVVRTLATGSGMMPGARVQIGVTPLSAPPGAVRTLRVRARSADDELPVALSVESPSGSVERVVLAADPGTALVSIGSVVPNEEGVWTVSDGSGLETRFVVVEDRVERTMLTQRTDETAGLARRTGGVVLTVEDGPEALVSALASEREATTVPARAEPVWNRWWWALLLAALLVGEWVWRRVGL